MNASHLRRLYEATRSGLRRYPRALAGSLRDGAADASAQHNPHAQRALERLLAADDGAMWLGHASLLLRIGGLTVLTDPVFSDRIGPRLAGRTLGIQRLAPMPIDPDRLPRPDVILLSHAHFDHLDTPTLRRLASPDTTIVTARATRGLIPDGFRHVVELDWSRELRIRGVRLTALRTEHWGARAALDRHRGHNAYLIEAGERRTLFGGDTALTDAFDRIGPVDIAALGIGAYESWDHRHATPEQAWTMFERMRARRLMPMHHATFDLGEPHAGEPMERLLAAAKDRSTDLVCPNIGDAWTHHDPRTPPGEAQP